MHLSQLFFFPFLLFVVIINILNTSAIIFFFMDISLVMGMALTSEPNSGNKISFSQSLTLTFLLP